MKSKTEYEDTWFDTLLLTFKVCVYMIVSPAAVSFALLAHLDFVCGYDFMAAVHNSPWAYSLYINGHILIVICLCGYLFQNYLKRLTKTSRRKK